MTDRELTPEVAAEFFGKPSEPADTTPTEATEQPIVELDGDQAELARRYSLSAEDAKRIRGDTWAERCEDAERLAGMAGEQSIRERARRHLRALQQDNPNRGELAALSQDTREWSSRLLESMHPDESTEPEEPEGPPGFDGGARKSEPPPRDPVSGHDEIAVELARRLKLGGPLDDDLG